MIQCMLFSVLQNPRCRMLLLKGNPLTQPISNVSSWRCFCSVRNTIGTNCSLKSGSSHSSRQLWIDETKKLSATLKQQEITKTNLTKNNAQSSKPGTVRQDELLDGVVKSSTEIQKKQSKVGDFEGIEYCDVQHKIECGNSQRLVTIIVFDTETTGFSREYERIIEIALRDLGGGENSTFETLVNPECDVPNCYIHGISTNMVNQPTVPRFKDLIPILCHYVRSRQIPNTPVLFVSHNAKSFDVPFLINEFSRCSKEIPSDWLFLDSLVLAREFAKLEDTKTSLGALREHFKIPLVGDAHRAMSDAYTLAIVLQKLTVSLKLTTSSLLKKSFKASDIVNAPKKKKSTN